jgi:hypothetical protein
VLYSILMMYACCWGGVVVVMVKSGAGSGEAKRLVGILTLGNSNPHSAGCQGAGSLEDPSVQSCGEGCKASARKCLPGVDVSK